MQVTAVSVGLDKGVFFWDITLACSLPEQLNASS
jgi:hypothetical protein